MFYSRIMGLFEIRVGQTTPNADDFSCQGDRFRPFMVDTGLLRKDEVRITFFLFLVEISLANA